MERRGRDSYHAPNSTRCKERGLRILHRFDRLHYLLNVVRLEFHFALNSLNLSVLAGC